MINKFLDKILKIKNIDVLRLNVTNDQVKFCYQINLNNKYYVILTNIKNITKIDDKEYWDNEEYTEFKWCIGAINNAGNSVIEFVLKEDQKTIDLTEEEIIKILSELSELANKES
jgi:hypothetical protein